jgi:hypothetical protein
MMSPQVQVRDIEEVERFRGALVTFLAAAGDSLLAVDMELRRFVDWLRGEQPRRLDRAYIDSMEKVAQARTALQRKMIVLPGERHPDLIEEQKALRQAQHRREDLETRIANVRRWTRIIEPILDDYRGEARQLANLVEGDPAASLRFLDSALAQLHAYLDVAVPTPTTLPPASGSAKSMAMESDQTTESASPTANSEDEHGVD